MDRENLYRTFWHVYVRKGPSAATIIYNNFTVNRLAVPTFLKFVNKDESNRKSFVCINIQEHLKPKHIDSLAKGWPEGQNDTNVSNIWYRLLRESNIVLKQLPIVEKKGFIVTFYPVEFKISNVPMKAGYIILDFSNDNF